jgi:argininosuccinate lyase
LPIDRELTAELLGFSRPSHNVLHAINSRGKCESIILFAMAQSMLTLSRLAADLIIFTMPEIAYFSLPQEYCTGSSIMPNKSNPDVLELVRAKAATVLSSSQTVCEILRGLPGGYNRDLQETKAPFMQGIADTRASLNIVGHLMQGLKVNNKVLTAAFTPEVFAADEALELVARGVPFREAYDAVKDNLDELENQDPSAAIAAKTHLGATAGLNFDLLTERISVAQAFAKDERRHYCRAITKLMGSKYVEV